jgi:hypothetical protein
MRSLVLAVVAGLLLPASVRSEVPVRIPFQYRDGLVWVKIELADNKGRLNLLVDSGASVSAIDLQTAQAYGMHFGGRCSVQGVSGQTLGYNIEDLRCNLAGNSLPKSFVGIDLGTVSKCCHQHIDGILGLDFFRNHIVRIDFGAGEICLLRDCDPNLKKSDVLPMKIRNGAFCVPVRIDRDTEQWMRLDTGCDSALEWVVNRSRTRQTAGQSIGLSTASAHCIKASVQLGKSSFNQVMVGIHAKPMFPGEDGLLGNGLLSKFSVTIDGPGSRVILEKPQ